MKAPSRGVVGDEEGEPGGRGVPICSLPFLREGQLFTGHGQLLQKEGRREPAHTPFLKLSIPLGKEGKPGSGHLPSLITWDCSFRC